MSPQQKRSTQYDWFKGGTQNSVQKTPKEKAKTIWKFVKILLYTALFGFSMTGCIQTFVIKTQTQVGRGVEFFSNADEVAPHVSTFQGSSSKHAEVKDANGNVTSHAFTVYKLSSVDGNFWLNKSSNGKAGTIVPGSLADVHAAISKQAPNLQMQDAYKATNEGFRLLPVGASTDRADRIASLDGHPVAISSLAQTYAQSYTKDQLKDLLQGLYVPNGTAKQYEPLGADTLKDFDTSNDYIAALNKIPAADQPKWIAKMKAYSGFVYDTLKSFLNYNLLPETTVNGKVTSKVYTVQQYLSQNPTKAPVSIPATATDDIAAYHASQAAMLSSITNYLHISSTPLPTSTKATNTVEDLTNGFTLPYNYIPSSDAKMTSDWRPFVSWSDAWSAGPFYGIFVYPIAYIAANMINAMPFMSGWETLISIFIVVFLMRAITFALSFKATMQQTKMQELTGKKAIIDAKYAAYKGNKQMENRQKQEVSEMYKKEGVSMFGSISSIFLTMPFFLAIWRTIGALPHIKSTIWLGINFSATSWKELFAGNFSYLPLMVLAALFAGFQQIFPRLLTKRRDKNRINVHQKAAMKKSNKTQNIMMLVFVFMALIFSAGLQVYWIAGGVWMTIQSYVTHRLFIRQSKNKKRRKIKV